MADDEKQAAEAQLRNAQQRLEQEDTPENRKAVEEAKREVDRISQNQ